MISKPLYGWCYFKLGTFEGAPSYLTDVPGDLLNAFIDYYTRGTGIAWFDEEGSEFTLVINPNSIFIIEEREKPILHNFSELKVEALTKELIDDIEKILDAWVVDFFMEFDNQEHIKVYRAEITQRIAKLKNILEGEKCGK